MCYQDAFHKFSFHSLSNIIWLSATEEETMLKIFPTFLALVAGITFAKRIDFDQSKNFDIDDRKDCGGKCLKI